MSNPFVKTPEQLKAIQEEIRELRCDSSTVEVEFETTEEFIREITPPCFTPVKGKPYIKVSVVLQLWPGWRGHGRCTTVYVLTSYKGQEGYFDIRMFLESEEEKAIYVGREVYGESKVMGNNFMVDRGNKRIATVDARGQKIIELFVETNDENLGSDEYVVEKTFGIKATPDAQGNGFTYPPQILTFEYAGTTPVYKVGKGEIILRNSPSDPLGEIPIVKVIEGRYYEWDGIYRVAKIDEMEDGDAYLPYYYGQKARDFNADHKLLGSTV